MSNSTQNKDPIINGEWGSPAPYKVNRWVKKDSTQNDWEKRYEEFITFVTNEKNWIDGKPVWKEYKYVTLANAIMDFIRKELADARREVIKDVEKMKKTGWDLSKIDYGFIDQGYNQAISDVLATLRKG